MGASIMSLKPNVKILCGGISDEREVSLKTGKSMYDALKDSFHAELIQLDKNQLPEGINSKKDIVVPAIHGQFGEDGGLQDQLDLAGIIYAGCDAASSRLCMHKSKAKATVSKVGVPVPKEITFTAISLPDAKQVINSLGKNLIIKPVGSGSSVGLFALEGIDELKNALSKLDSHEYTGSWMIESRIIGREITVGILGSNAMGLVEIRPKSGLYDFEHKYTSGHTEYLYPAEVSNAVKEKICALATKAFKACGCRDFSRIDFMLSPSEEPHFLEINTIPGLTGTSLMPKSAACIGIELKELVKGMIAPALERFSLQAK
jgi:D-alanine-D-alanine ligase